MKRLALKDFANVMQRNEDKNFYIAATFHGDLDDKDEVMDENEYEAWYVLKIVHLGEFPVLICNYSGSEDPYSLRIYPISGYVGETSDGTPIVHDLEHAIWKYIANMGEFDSEEAVYWDNEEYPY